MTKVSETKPYIPHLANKTPVGLDRSFLTLSSQLVCSRPFHIIVFSNFFHCPHHRISVHFFYNLSIQRGFFTFKKNTEIHFIINVLYSNNNITYSIRGQVMDANILFEYTILRNKQ